MVVMKLVVKEPSENRKSRQLLPTPARKNRGVRQKVVLYHFEAHLLVPMWKIYNIHIESITDIFLTRQIGDHQTM